ncbi:MAG: hypothetical protein H7A25_24085 [Leptospiraceae bacterium]|nr:hypothetical protein [Leptospiraceae bacterium]MCP5503003.1 hypothetical protein [Leptospiraceae bacterium]
MNERQIESTNFAIQFANGTYGDAKLIETEATIHETIHAIRKANNALGSKDDGKDY